MYSEFDSFEDLRVFVQKDKDSTGLDASTRNRYPIRFVLFDNFRDCSLFVEYIQNEMGTIVESVDKWLDPDYPDIMITHVDLANRFNEFIHRMNGNDCVIAPFSELARFYDNNEQKTFDTLLKTIKAIQTSEIGINKHQRIYIPIVGLEGKMETFNQDSQSTIWRLRSDSKEFSYRLIITNKKTFGVKGLNQHYTLVHSMHEWLNVWKNADKQVNPDIICTSSSIFANAIYAQPDNAFNYINCNDAYEFLTKGLKLSFGGLTQKTEDGNNWEELADKIDLTNGFSFPSYVLDYFSINAIDTYQTFIRLWLEHQGVFERWLLTKYYQIQPEANKFICENLNTITSFIGNDFLEKLVLNMTELESEIVIRKYCLTEAAKRNVTLRECTISTLSGRLNAIADKYNESTALKYFTGLSEQEKHLIISWYSKGKITLQQTKDYFPDFYYYLVEPLGISIGTPEWIAPYFAEYKKAKVTDTYTDEIANEIKEHNGNAVAFDSWYHSFSTVRTLLKSRSDIDVFYWIDGLGIEWIPLIKEIIREKNNHGMYLNEIKIARAILPSVTEVNRLDLQKILPQGTSLLKNGDLDSLAHQNTNTWPQTIVNEIELVRKSIEEIISKFNGKKIAIISDHGLTYLSQKCDGLGFVGVESNHHGRVAFKANGNWTTDENYFNLEDGKTVCALNHKSLSHKVPKGQGIHGGCTPEEILVPIFIISDHENDTQWSADIITVELKGVNPTIQFKIKNIPSTEIPYIEYNKEKYTLHQVNTDIFESSSITVNNECKKVTLVIGNETRSYFIEVNAGIQEEDLFGAF